ncbi:multiple epidermal growth factor-like domains protein 10 [Biomphalaria glabrata]|uniref:Multiple epidermal growth factor-like domains protein 10 n=1 Tax=Biomphalaria glabrata TaxID=6526 RepID=A0A9W3AJ59_BIOGL|nr:multiple epidermal growth factor-like domains protein 10 [Biomphalaria glabrata]
MSTSSVTRDAINITVCASFLLLVVMVTRSVGGKGGMCPGDRFGQQCRLTCHCANKELCDDITGQCPGPCAEGWSGPHCQRQNVALGRSTDMKTSDWSRGDFAVDGNLRTCVTSSSNRTGWWRVDMQDKRTVFFMEIHFANQTARPGRVRVHVSDYVDTFYGKPCTRIQSAHKLSKFTCDLPSTGRYFGLINKEGQITLCEVLVFVCAPFTYGVDCSQECTCADPSEQCNPVTGSCISGCKDGWMGSACNKPCAGRYGRNCRQACGHCFGNQTCDHVTGSCLKGCAPGWKGPRCKQDCDPGNYGVECIHQCHHCLDNDTCDPSSGECPWRCAPGWRGRRCDSECEPGFHGQSCEFRCGHCHGNSTCDATNGLCPVGCSSGYEGLFCTKECLPGKWGPNCQWLCGQCQASTCDRITGHCGSDGCRPGWSGDTCLTGCRPGTYGSSCLRKCGACDTPCNATDGLCPSGCLSGWEGPTCTSKCSNRSFGPGCQLPCGQCANSEPCHHVTGYCLHACERGYERPFCHIRNRTDLMGKPNLLTLLVACMILFMLTIVAVTVCLVVKWRQINKVVKPKSPIPPFQQTVV